MKAVVPAAGEGTRLRPLTDDTPKALVEVAGEPLLTHCFEALLDLDVEEFVVVVGYRKEDVIRRYGDAYSGVPITYTHQREQRGLAHAVLTAEPHVEEDFVVLNGDNVFRANLDEAVARHREADADATVLVESVSREEASRTGVFELEDGSIVSLVEKPDDPPSTLVTTGFFVFSPVVFHACHLVQPSERGEYELADAIDLLLSAGRPVEAVRLDGWRVNVNTADDRDAAAARLG